MESEIHKKMTDLTRSVNIAEKLANNFIHDLVKSSDDRLMRRNKLLNQYELVEDNRQLIQELNKSTKKKFVKVADARLSFNNDFSRRFLHH